MTFSVVLVTLMPCLRHVLYVTFLALELVEGMQTSLNRDFKDFFFLNYKHYNIWKHLHSFYVAESYCVV